MSKAAELAKMGEVVNNGLGRRNIIINGAMQVFQRGTSLNQSGGASTYDHVADRFRYEEDIEQWAGTMSQDSSTPADEQFQYSLKTLTTTVETTIDASDFCQHCYYVEVNDGARIGFGKGSCNVSTLSFWVRSSVTGTYCIGISNDDGTQTLPLEYTISSADTWEKKVLTVPARTSGTWATTGNAKLMGIRWLLGKAGSSYTGGTNGTWSNDTSWAKLYSGSTLADWSRTANSTFYLTGVQYEVGSQDTPFEHRSYAEELVLCQRYFENDTLAGFYMPTYTSGGSPYLANVPFKVNKRTGSGTFTVTTGTGGTNNSSVHNKYVYHSSADTCGVWSYDAEL